MADEPRTKAIGIEFAIVDEQGRVIELVNDRGNVESMFTFSSRAEAEKRASLIRETPRYAEVTEVRW